jgi:hypothetical protein
VRDLLGVDFKPADDFPSDDVGSGFDNIGDVLSLPPLLMEKYLAAAEMIAEKTILTTPPVKLNDAKKEGNGLRGEGAAELRGGRWAILSGSCKVSPPVPAITPSDHASRTKQRIPELECSSTEESENLLGQRP